MSAIDFTRIIRIERHEGTTVVVLPVTRIDDGLVQLGLLMGEATVPSQKATAKRCGLFSPPTMSRVNKQSRLKECARRQLPIGGSCQEQQSTPLFHQVGEPERPRPLGFTICCQRGDIPLR